MNIPCNKYFKDKVVVITGAGGVLCGVLAEAYASCGAKVALLDLSFENADRKAQEIRDLGYVAKAYTCNVLKEDSIAEAHAKI